MGESRILFTRFEAPFCKKKMNKHREVLTAHFKNENDAVYIEKYAVDQYPWVIYVDWVILANEKIPQLLTALEMGLFEPPHSFQRMSRHSRRTQCMR